MSVDDSIPICRNYIDIDGKDGLEKLETINIEGQLNSKSFLRGCVRTNIDSLIRYSEQFSARRSNFGTNNYLTELFANFFQNHGKINVRNHAKKNWIDEKNIDTLIPHLLGLHYFSSEHIGEYISKLRNVQSKIDNPGIDNNIQSIIGDKTNVDEQLLSPLFIKLSLKQLPTILRVLEEYIGDNPDNILQNIQDIDKTNIMLYNKFFLLLISHCLKRYIWLCIIDLVYKKKDNSINKIISNKLKFIIEVMYDIQTQFIKALCYKPKPMLEKGVNYTDNIDINQYDIRNVKENILIVTTDWDQFIAKKHDAQVYISYNLTKALKIETIKSTDKRKDIFPDKKVYISFFSTNNGKIDYVYIPKLYNPYDVLINHMPLIDVPSVTLLRDNNVLNSTDIFECSSGLETFFNTLCNNMAKYLESMHYILHTTFIQKDYNFFRQRFLCIESTPDCRTINHLFINPWHENLVPDLNNNFHLYLLSLTKCFFTDLPNTPSYLSPIHTDITNQKETQNIYKNFNDIIKLFSENNDNVSSTMFKEYEKTVDKLKLLLKIIIIYNEELVNQYSIIYGNLKNYIIIFISSLIIINYKDPILSVETTPVISKTETKESHNKTYLNLNYNFLKSCIELSDNNSDINTIKETNILNYNLQIHPDIKFQKYCNCTNKKVFLYEINYIDNIKLQFNFFQPYQDRSSPYLYFPYLYKCDRSTTIGVENEPKANYRIVANIEKYFKKICDQIIISKNNSDHDILNNNTIHNLIGLINIFFGNDIIVHNLLHKAFNKSLPTIKDLNMENLCFENYCDKDTLSIKQDLYFNIDNNVDFLKEQYTHYIIHQKDNNVLLSEKIKSFQPSNESS